jgi:hypothetical protein
MYASICKSKIHAFAIALIVVLSVGSQAFGAHDKKYTELRKNLQPFFTWEGILRLVLKGDKIIVDLKSLKDKNNVSTVKWSQSLKKREADYVQTVAAIESDDVPVVFSIFVQLDQLDKFLKNCSATDEDLCRMKVNSDFQYGEDDGGSYRFLVFHDPKSKPYMGRFMNSNSMDIFQDNANRLVQQLGKTQLHASVSFTVSNYKRNEGYLGPELSPIYSKETTRQDTYFFDQLRPELKTTFIEEKSEWCFDQSKNIYDASVVQEIYGQCKRWERRAWQKMASPYRASTRPEDLGKSNQEWIRCVNTAKALNNGNSTDQYFARQHDEEVCEQKRKLDLLSLGADPTLNYAYGKGAAADSNFTNGNWRLDR